MSEANFQVALREAERATKKQRTCAGNCADAVAVLHQHLQAVRQQVGPTSGTYMLLGAFKRSWCSQNTSS